PATTTTAAAITTTNELVKSGGAHANRRRWNDREHSTMNGKKSAARRGLTTLTPAVLSLALMTVVGCKGAPASKAATTPPAMLVGPENIAVVKGEQLRSGPAISGTLQPEEQANVRAEVGGTILKTLA